MGDLGFKAFDCDNHYYEAEDAFSRYIEPEYRKRAMQWAAIDGKTRLLVGGKVNHFIPNPLFDPIPNPAPWTSTSAAATPKGRDPRTLR